MRLAAHLLAAGAALTFLALIIGIMGAVARICRNRADAAIMRLLTNDLSPAFATDFSGRIRFVNPAGHQHGIGRAGSRMSEVLAGFYAEPDAVVIRCVGAVSSRGVFSDEIVTRGGRTRLTVMDAGRQVLLWRFEAFEIPRISHGDEALGIPILVVNTDGVVLYCNAALRTLIGARPRLLSDVLETATPRHGEEVLLKQGGLRLYCELEESKGRKEICLLPPGAAGHSVHDDAFENVPVPLMRFSADGALGSANISAREQLGLQDDAVNFADLFEGLGRSVSEWLFNVASGRVPAAAEVLRLKQSEEDVYLQVTLHRIVEGGRPAVLAVLIDATAMKVLEAQFNQSQKMQAVGQLAGGIAHDFNNLLTAISGHCDLLLLRHDQGDPEYADLVQIHQNANRAASLVGQLLAFSRKQTLKPERLDLSEVMSDLGHLLNRLVGERVRLVLRHGSDLGAVSADRRQLEQVIMNLVVNARDAMMRGGTIVIETERVLRATQLERDRAVMPAGEYSAIRVIDEGTGIAPDKIGKIFEPFFTTKKVGEGTGLGLSTVYGIIKQSGGFIFVDSTPEVGSTFTVYLPVREDVPPEVPKPVAAPVVMRQGEGVVLLVEDEAPVRAFASRALQLRGYTVIEATNAEDALDRLSDPSLMVDVFVTDVVMPGMDGPTWVRHALRQRPDTRVIFVSGYAEENFSDSQMQIPNSVFLPKPFSLNDLTETVRRQLH